MSEKVVAVIPARAGSKGLPGKNKKLLGGKPLIQWSIEAALNSETIDEVIVSTDDEDILKLSKIFNDVTFVSRSDYLSGDDVKTLPVVLDCLRGRPDSTRVVLLQPTSPLRRKGRIDEAVRKSMVLNVPVVSVVKSGKSPFQAFRLSRGKLKAFFDEDNTIEQPRQKFDTAYYLNGSIYVTSISWLKNFESFLEPSASTLLMNQIESIDIDDGVDFQIVEALETYFQE